MIRVKTSFWQILVRLQKQNIVRIRLTFLVLKLGAEGRTDSTSNYELIFYSLCEKKHKSLNKKQNKIRWCMMIHNKHQEWF